ncbi:MAG: hypothetical protein M3O09_05035 [Acidobacteriota bacterium]|nr:hypothetical protein [Acidobacteriota bacterium]
MNPQLQLVLWVSQPLLQLLVMGTMIQRKLHGKFPVFFAYIISQIAAFAITFPLHKWGGYQLYFYGYWICETISLVICFMVIHEIFVDVFRVYHTLRDLGSVLFKWAALVMLLVAAVVMAASPVSKDPLLPSIMTLQRCIQVIQCGLILFLLVFCRYLGVSWRQHSFGISLGFGGAAGLELMMVALFASGQVKLSAMNTANMFACNVSIVVWLGYMLAKSKAYQAVGVELVTQRWEQSLADLQHPRGDDSLIPMFEGMVDRAFSKTPSDWAPGHDDQVAKQPVLRPYVRKVESRDLTGIA